MRFIAGLWMVFGLFLAIDVALGACPEDSIDSGETSSANNPVQMVVDCACINWTAPVDFAVNHYHVFVNGIMRAYQEPRAYLHCMTEKRVVEEIIIETAASEQGIGDIPLSDPLFIEWVDRQCLDVNRVVLCP